MTGAAIAPAVEFLAPEQELYRAEKARRAGRIRPEMEAAAAELRRLDALRVEQGKGGRPKGSGMTLGKNARPWKRAAEPDPDAPGRPEWLTPPTPVKDDEPHLTPASSTPMPRKSPTYPPRTCAACAAEFIPRGGRQITCDDACKAALKGAPAPKKQAKAKPDKKKKKAIRTGFTRETPSTRGASTSSTIADLQEQLATVDARRQHLVDAIDALLKLERLEAA